MTRRNTRQKQAVYDALVALGHPSALQVYEYMRGRGDNVGRGTVFRVLKAFAKDGRAVRLRVSGSDDIYDATLAPHFHARCRVCGGVRDVVSPVLASALESVAAEGFFTERTEVVFYGVCEKCRNRAAYESNE